MKIRIVKVETLFIIYYLQQQQNIIIFYIFITKIIYHIVLFLYILHNKIGKYWINNFINSRK